MSLLGVISSGLCMESASIQRQSFGPSINNNADPQLHSVVMLRYTVQPQTLNHSYIPLSFVPRL